MFHVGQLVIRIQTPDGYPFPLRPPQFGETLPMVGVVYTVRDCGRCPFRLVDAIHLEEIVNRPRLYAGSSALPYECWWPADLFRPVDVARLDVFRQAVEKTPELA